MSTDESDRPSTTIDTAALYRLESDAVRCPYDIFERYRSESPVTWEPDIEAFVVSRYDDIVNVNRQPTLFSSRLNLGPVLDRQMREIVAALVEEGEPDVAKQVARAGAATDLHNGVLVNADPPVHSRQRALVNQAFSLRRVRSIEDDLVSIVDGLIDGLDASAEINLVQNFAVPFPIIVIANALGVPLASMPDFRRWSDDFVRAMGNHNLTKADLTAIMRSQGEFYDFFEDQIAARRANPRDDLITDIVEARIDGEALSESEMLEAITQILVAGNETTTKLIAGAVLRLARDPDLADELRTNPDQVSPFVEEVLRLDPPVQGLFRIATQDTVVGGVEISAGKALWVIYASGNRDSDRFESPDELCPGRRPTPPHLSFGHGEHYCLGANLARAEARVAIQRLLARFDKITVSLDDEQLDYVASYLVHGLHELPVQLTPRQAATT